MGKEGKYDLKLAEPPSAGQEREDVLVVDNCGEYGIIFSLFSYPHILKSLCFLSGWLLPPTNGPSHPNSALQVFTQRFIQLLCMNSAMHCQQLDFEPLAIICKHLRTLISAVSNADVSQVGVMVIYYYLTIVCCWFSPM